MKTRSKLPTAVICAYDEVALAMIYSFTGNGIRIPEQVRYDYVEESQRVNALAINQTFYGLAGFLTTLALSPVLALIQENGNKIFGMTIYAQQLFSAFSMVITLILLVYVLRVVNKIKKVEATEENFEQE